MAVGQPTQRESRINCAELRRLGCVSRKVVQPHRSSSRDKRATVPGGDVPVCIQFQINEERGELSLDWVPLKVDQSSSRTKFHFPEE